MRNSQRITEIGLRRTQCRGTCPVYSVVIQSDGSFVYKGERHVHRLGEHTGMIHQWSLRQLAQFIVDSKFLDLQDNYLDAPLDLSSTFLTIIFNEKKKEIENYGDSGPSLLWAIAEIIDKLLDEANWD